MKLSPKAALLIIAAIFVLPLVLAWLMYEGTIEYRPASTRNFGKLVEPPLPISWAEVSLSATAPPAPASEVLDEHWVVLYAVPEPCAEQCSEEVRNLRQIHKASGRQQSRIRIALLVPGQADGALTERLSEIYEPFFLIENPDGSLRNAMDEAAAGSRTYLIDPLGNIMMSYEAGADPNDLKRDLKRLLTWSKLDEQQ